jgi:conjugal transfer pilus assembly protein TrbC
LEKTQLLCFLKRLTWLLCLYPVLAWAHPPVQVFISFSMPPQSLQSWVQQARRIHAPLLLRGLVDHSLTATVLKLRPLLKGGGGINLDPVAFQTFHITQVPAVLVSCGKDFEVVYGNVSLSYALQTIAQRGIPACASIAKENSL